MKPGDKVVCVNDKPCMHCFEPVKYKKDLVYVIKDVIPISNGKVGLRLIGVSTHTCFYKERIQRVSRFRLLDELKQQAAKQQAAKQQYARTH